MYRLKHLFLSGFTQNEQFRHPERSEGSHRSLRFFTSFRMTLYTQCKFCLFVAVCCVPTLTLAAVDFPYFIDTERFSISPVLESGIADTYHFQATGKPQTLQPANAWRQHAVAVKLQPGKHHIAIVLDDLGVNRNSAEAAMALPAPLTLAFMSYAEHLSAMTAMARQRGHELLVHMPMQPKGEANPGQYALMLGLAPWQIKHRLEWGLSRFAGYIGINNHMGSAFTENAAGMNVVMETLKARGLMFLDSRTTAATVAQEAAQQAGVNYIARDVFLDNVDSLAGVRQQLHTTEHLALQHGQAVAIGHPHPNTLAALRAWLPTLAGKGLQLVPLSALIKPAITTEP